MSGSDSEDFQTTKSYTNRRQYLATYSKADLIKFPTRKSFCDALISCFNATRKVVVEYWACCLEEHKNTLDYHYHASVRLSGPKRWNPVKKRLHEKFGIQVNFSESYENYYSAYRYACKNDSHVYKSADHPDLQEIGSPVKKKCMSAYRQKCRKRKIDENAEITANQPNDSDKINGNKMQNASLSKVRRLSSLDVSKFLVKNNIRTMARNTRHLSTHAPRDMSISGLHRARAQYARFEHAFEKRWRIREEHATRDKQRKKCATVCTHLKGDMKERRELYRPYLPGSYEVERIIF